MKKSFVAAFFLVAILLSSKAALAHVVVKPNQVGVGAFQTFTVGVPSEKAQSTIELRLLFPDGLNYVMPNVKPGWSIRVKKEDPANPDKVTEIAWFGGNIPKGQRDEFSFSAQVPANETVLQWKAHQIYSDGGVVSWDQSKDSQPKDSSGNDDFSKVGPYSETKIVNDLAPMETAAKTGNVTWPLVISILALVLSLVSLAKKSAVVHHHTDK